MASDKFSYLQWPGPALVAPTFAVTFNVHQHFTKKLCVSEADNSLI